MWLASIHTYPVKGCRRLDLDRAQVEPWGLAGDRRWMVVQADGDTDWRAVTQREAPALALVAPRVRDDGGLTLRTPGQADLAVPAPGGDAPLEPMPVRLHRDTVTAALADSAAADWLSAVVDRKVRLVYLDDPTRRVVNPKYARAADRVGFADAYPLLLANTAALDAVNDWLVADGSDEAPLPMTRFRPNVVVAGATAWAEDGWLGGRLRLGAVTFRVVKACDRCVVTTIDQDTAEPGQQPLRILGRYRRTPGGLLFGTYLIPDDVGEIAVGDPVTWIR